MVIFWSLVAIMLLISLVLSVRHLLFSRQVESSGSQNPVMTIFKQRLQELEQERDNGMITEEQMQKAKTELERSLLEEVNASGQESEDAQVQVTSDWKTAGVIAVLVPLLAIGLYFQLGEPKIIDAIKMLDAHNSAATREEQLASVDRMVDSLATRLKDNPDDVQGWTMLARSYKVMGRFNEAQQAFEHLLELVGEDPDVLLQYADTIATVNNGRLAGRPEELILRALELTPDNAMGLWLAGMAARERADNETALDYWRRLLPMVQEDAESYQEVRNLIRGAEEALGIVSTEDEPPPVLQQQTETAGDKSLRVSVSLSPELAGSVNASDALFIFARATSGPPMPLAAARLTVKDLPVELTLDDSMAMMPTLKISGYDSVLVNARVSKSGTPTESSGDLVAQAVTAQPGQPQLVELIIGTVVP